MTALAGEKLGLFTEKKLTLSSASDISFAGKKRITLTGGGAICDLRPGRSSMVRRRCICAK